MILPDGRDVDLAHFVEWRPWLWRPAVQDALRNLGDLRGKRVLDVGCRYGRMSCLFALHGAQVVGIDIRPEALPRAHEEAKRWMVEDRVRFLSYDGNPAGLDEPPFDVVFTKSVLWVMPNLDEMLAQLDLCLAANGRVAFVENVHGGAAMMWLRRNVIHGRKPWVETGFHGITRRQLPLFRERFADVTIRRHRFLVYTILGRKREAERRESLPHEDRAAG